MQRRNARLLMLLPVLLLTSSCGNLFGASQGDSFCIVARPLQFSDPALNAMNRSDLLQVKALNDSYAKLCP
jgi:hypothetical protein